VYKRRFIKILEPLENWVDKESIIVTDFTVDKHTLHTMGFRHVYQVSLTDAQPRNSRGNHNVMEYLRRIVPRMFQVKPSHWFEILAGIAAVVRK